MNNQKVAFGNIELPIQIGFWRSVGYSQNSFFAESFMDECAHAVGKDPYEFRRNKNTDRPEQSDSPKLRIKRANASKKGVRF